MFVGFNPRWDEVVNFTITTPQLAVVRFAIYDSDRYVDDFIGYYVLPFTSMQEGKEIKKNLINRSISLNLFYLKTMRFYKF